MTNYKLADVRDGSRNVDAYGMVTDVKRVQEVSLRTGGQAKVTEVELTDPSGSVKVTLWDAEGDGVAKGTYLKITNGYAKAYKGEVSLSVGRYGRLEKEARPRG